MEEGDEPRAETESESEEELSCFAPTVSTRTCNTIQYAQERVRTFKGAALKCETTRGSSSVECWSQHRPLCDDVDMGTELRGVPNDLEDYVSSTTTFHQHNGRKYTVQFSNWQCLCYVRYSVAMLWMNACRAWCRLNKISITCITAVSDTFILEEPKSWFYWEFQDLRCVNMMIHLFYFCCVGQGGCENYSSGYGHHRLGAIGWRGVYFGERRLLCVQSHNSATHRRVRRWLSLLVSNRFAVITKKAHTTKTL